MSRFEFKLPDIGEGVSEGEIVGWLVHVGDSVSENQDMVEVMTDKATVTIGAPKSGKVVEIRGGEGDTVPVGAVLVVLDVGAESGAAQSRAAERAVPSSPQNEPRATPGGARTAEPAPEPPRVKGESNGGRAGLEASNVAPAAEGRPPAAAPTVVGDLKETLPGMTKAPRVAPDDYRNDKPLASPATRKLARELGVDLRRVRPSGDAGRVTREDVEQFVGAPETSHAMARAPSREGVRDAGPSLSSGNGTAAAHIVAKAPSPPVPSAQGETRVPIRGLRKRIFENMARAKHTAAHFTYVDECDVTELKRMREAAKPAAARSGVQLTYLPFIVKAVVAALKRHPALNCLVDDSSMEMVLRSTYDIGIAVATDAGLTVPVLRGADHLTIIEAAREMERLSTEARAGKTRREDLGGSSFTITSLGKDGGLFATPVVNYPEVAILGVHQIKRKPVVRGDQIVPGDVMLLSLSFDHRVIDGHVGAAFAQEVIGFLQAPERLLLEMR